uniref:Replication-associated protein n=1 Tax=Ficedula mugimaki CRESS-DNA-virus sp. TaxID=2815035 RepID=A0A8A4XB04_9VIRU|nr:MAG: replication-associated protein [Ficedula mugimaki CRESS-DNA-virus sp.]
MAKRPHSKYWCFTLYADECPWTEKNCSYCIYGREICPDTGKKHLQGFVAFEKSVRLSAIKKTDSVGHYEMKRGTVAQAIEYCKKDGYYVEIGDVPSDDSGVAIRTCIEYAQAGKMDEIKELSPALYLRYKRTFDGLRKFDIVDLTEPCGYWIYGEPGTSKDSNVKKLNPYVKPHNKWWDGFNGEKYVLISDLDRSTAKWIGTHLKIWTDMYPFDAEVKGGVIKIRPERVYVTSNFTIDELFSEDNVLLTALRRRFHVIDFDNDIVYRRPIIQHVDKIKLIDF